MTKEDKSIKRLEQANKRRAVKKKKNQIKFEHKKRFGSANPHSIYHNCRFECEMGYEDCEIRGYCNGDC